MNRKYILFVLICICCIVLFSSCGNGAEPAEQGSQITDNQYNTNQSQETTSWQEQYDLGMKYLVDRNYEEAIIAFTTSIKASQYQAHAYVGRGNAYVLSGETEEKLASAQADYKAALALDDTIASAWLGLADVYIRQGDFDRALDILREGLEKADGEKTIADKIEEIESGHIIDSSGNVRRLNGYDSSGKLAWYHIFDYNDLNQQSAVTAYDADGNQISYMEFPYDEEGRLLKRNDYYTETGEISGYSAFEYDEHGNIVKSTFCLLDGTPQNYDVFEYNTDGLRIASSRYECNKEGDYLSTSSEYNEQGNEAKTTWYDVNGNVHGYYTYEYDSDGKRTRYNNCAVDGTIREYCLYLYDNDGSYIGEEYYNGDGSLQFSTTINH